MIINQIAAGGGSPEGQCIYNVYSLELVQNSKQGSKTYTDNPTTLVYYDEVEIDENANVVGKGEAKTYELYRTTDGVADANNVLVGKYVLNSEDLYCVIEFSRTGTYALMHYKAMATEQTLVRYGVTDDSEKYATLIRCSDGLYRENAE